MELRNKVTVVRNVGIHHLSLLRRCKTQNAVVLSLEVADGMIKTTLKQLGNRVNSFYMASGLYVNMELLEHRATTSPGKPVSILRGIAGKMSPFLPSW